YPLLYCAFSLFLCFLNATATPEIYTLSLHDALPISAPIRMMRIAPHCDQRLDPGVVAVLDVAFAVKAGVGQQPRGLIEPIGQCLDRKSTRLNSSHVKISYAVFCLKKKKNKKKISTLQ